MPSFRNRKGDISQNMLAACNFDVEFMYVLSGWEGSAHDSKVLNDALTRNSNRLPVPEGKYMFLYCKYVFFNKTSAIYYCIFYKKLLLYFWKVLCSRLWISKSSKLFSSVSWCQISPTRIFWSKFTTNGCKRVD